jgi:hypothetical protein
MVDGLDLHAAFVPVKVEASRLAAESCSHPMATLCQNYAPPAEALQDARYGVAMGATTDAGVAGLGEEEADDLAAMAERD